MPAPAHQPDHVLLAVDDETLTYAEADRRSAELARALLAAGAGAGTRVALLYPNNPAFVVAWLAAARIGAVSVPLSTFSTSAELVGLLRGADVSLLLAARSYRSQDYGASLTAGIEGLDLAAAPPLLSAGRALPAPDRLRSRRVRPVDGPGVDDGRPPGRGGWCRPRGAGRRRAGGDGGRPHGDRPHLGLDERAQGCHPQPRRPDPSPGQPQPAAALRRQRDPLLEFPLLLDRRFRLRVARDRWSPGRRSSARARASAAGVLDVLERERPTMVNGFAASVAHVAQDPTFASRDLSSIRRGNLYPIMPAAVRPADPELHHAMLGMTEAGSVCLASDDESEQPEARPGLVRAARARARRAASSVSTTGPSAGRGRWASCTSGARSSWRATWDGSATRPSTPTTGSTPATWSRWTRTGSSTSTAATAT